MCNEISSVSGVPYPRNRNLIVCIPIAISMLVLACLSCKMDHTSGLQQLAGKIYKAPMAQNLPSKPSAEDSLYQIGMDAYAHKNWDKAITAFNQIPETHPLHNRIVYYTAHALIGNREYDKALALFNTQGLNNGEYVQQTGWYRILTKMFLNRPQEEIVPELNAIADEPHLYYCNNAKDVLKQMKAKK
ncbi:MAG: tetratricopeptide repeat protein [Saprospiraceae bacterium]|uniref:Tetratricopeptide repeat protein n=1 Tax=Candidatus Opimibacter skivensis TaxID=2982028 RepID=A0A9D7SRS4_9BACT|nr:tetratricopeptide repeat protein [Candidatus Opimibacter skivensis]